MLYILLSWAYVFLCASVIGVAVNHVFNLKNKLVVTQFLGFFAICLFASFFAVFYKIGLVFHAFLLAMLLVTAFFLRKNVKKHFFEFYASFSRWGLFLKICFAIITFLIVAQCASPPYVLDNESYYLQTIKWLNEFGLVKGLANLHIFFGQTSGWHILQAVFNFSFIYDNFNDLSGYCLWLGNSFAFQKLYAAFKSKERKTLYVLVGILPFANVLFFQFISAPSQNIPVIVICFIIFFLLIKAYNDLTKSDFISIAFLCFFVLFIKVISIFLIFVPLFLWVKNFHKINTVIHKVVLVGFLTFFILILKNLILTGYALFPLEIIRFESLDYVLPKEYIHLFYDNKYISMTFWQKFAQWLQQPGLEGLFNKLIIGLLLVFPFILKNRKEKKPLMFIYLLAVGQFAVLFFVSPQYRFFLVFILFFINVIFAQFIQKKNIIKTLLALSVVVSGIPLFFPIILNSLTKNERMRSPSNFEIGYFIEPHKNSKYDYTYETISEGNLNYQSPEQDAYFWVTGDGKLPCVNQKQIEHFKRKFGIVPQMRGSKLRKGFYSLEINETEILNSTPGKQ